ncbi:MAG TPA: GNAT family N-acetyltransferase [Planctomycetota bacterium]|nr:GNAT family N-acetyltransferase [Planctomycetota bacterium]
MVFRPTDYTPAINFLLKRPVPNRHLIGFLQLAEPGELDVYVDNPERPKGVMLLMNHSSDGKVVRRDVDIDTDSDESLVRLMGKLREPAYFFTFHREWMIPIIWGKFEKKSLMRSYYMRVTRGDFKNRATRQQAEHVREIREADRHVIEGYPDDWPSLRRCFEFTAAKWREGERALRMLGLFDSGRLVSWVQFWMGAGMCEVMNIHTHPGFRRKAYACTLLSLAAISIFKDHSEVYYTAPDDNTPSIQLAESVGFKKHSCTYYFNGTRR